MLGFWIRLYRCNLVKVTFFQNLYLFSFTPNFKLKGKPCGCFFYFPSFDCFLLLTVFLKQSIIDAWKRILNPPVSGIMQVAKYSCFFTAWKVPVFGVFSVRIFPHLDDICRGTEYLSTFSSNAGKYRSEKLRIRTILRSVCLYPQKHVSYSLFHFLRLKTS